MKLTNVDPATIDSPLAPVLRDLLKSPAIIAPKKADHIRELIAKQKIRLEVNDQAISPDFGVNRDRRIRTSLRGLEHLWGTLHAYLHLLDLAKAHPGQVMDLLTLPGGRTAREYLIWAFGDPTTPWPAGLPKPADIGDRMVVATNNLFLLCSGFILIHEIDHVVLGHAK